MHDKLNRLFLKDGSNPVWQLEFLFDAIAKLKFFNGVFELSNAAPIASFDPFEVREFKFVLVKHGILFPLKVSNQFKITSTAQTFLQAFVVCRCQAIDGFFRERVHVAF